MDDDNPTPATEDDVVDKVLGIGLFGFLVLLLGAAVLEQTGYYQGAMRLFPLVLTVFALIGVAWLLWKSPLDHE